MKKIYCSRVGEERDPNICFRCRQRDHNTTIVVCKVTHMAQRRLYWMFRDLVALESMGFRPRHLKAYRRLKAYRKVEE